MSDIWSLLSVLPLKRQQRLEDKMNDMNVEVTISDIIVIAETEESITIMVKDETGNVMNNMYFEYRFSDDRILVKRMLDVEASFFARLKLAWAYLFRPHSVTNKHGFIETTLSPESIVQLADFLVAVIDDFDPSNLVNNDTTIDDTEN